MDRTVEAKPIRTYCVLIDGADVIRIRADIMCEGTPTTFKLQGHVVGSISAEIVAWWIEETPAPHSGFA